MTHEFLYDNFNKKFLLIIYNLLQQFFFKNKNKQLKLQNLKQISKNKNANSMIENIYYIYVILKFYFHNIFSINDIIILYHITIIIILIIYLSICYIHYVNNNLLLYII